MANAANDNDMVSKGEEKKNGPLSRNMAKKLLGLNIWFVMVGILVLATASIFTFIMGIAHFLSFLFNSINLHHFHIPENFDAVICQILEINLIAVILFVCAIGLYLLFWKDIRVPEWLRVTNVNQLKEKLVGIIITVMGVTFLEHILHWQDPQGTLMFGAAIALVITALVFYTKVLTAEEEAEKDGHHGHGH